MLDGLHIWMEENMNFCDKNGTVLNIGDHIIPDEGVELVLVSKGYVEEFKAEVMFGQQVANLCSFSILTRENLEKQWTKLEVDSKE